ncbi:hypothetical protein FB451DRAFT_1527485 [Mycena latifolia]|nr:hypothetical protein FB451DRAFT_1527485 [Mycena latifolia]
MRRSSYPFSRWRRKDPHFRAAAAIPHSKLPEPWSCNWRGWGFLPYWNTVSYSWLDLPDDMLQKRLKISILKLIMFRSTSLDNLSMIFSGEEPTNCLVPRCDLGVMEGDEKMKYRSAYYLFDAPTRDVYRFEQPEGPIAGSIEEFMEGADWNNITHLGSLDDVSPASNATLNRSGPRLRLHELHNSETPWPPARRATRAPFLEHGRAIAVASREWCAIPDTHLPAPWSCDWSKWYGWSCGPELLQDTLRRWYNIAGRLNPIMFRSTSASLFESHGTFYLFEKLWSWDSRDGPDHNLYVFPGSYASVEDFLESCDWNQMQRIERALSTSGQIMSRAEAHRPLPLTHSESGLRLAAAQPYGKRNLLAMTRPKGTWSFEPRKWWGGRRRFSRRDLPHSTGWPSLRDTQLPAPFTCAWHAWAPAEKWYSTHEHDWNTQDELRRYWGVPGLVPVVYMATSEEFCIPTVLRAGETYYFWLFQEERTRPWLRRFEGTYESAEDFIENADWNRLAPPMEVLEPWKEDWDPSSESDEE